MRQLQRLIAICELLSRTEPEKLSHNECSWLNATVVLNLLLLTLSLSTSPAYRRRARTVTARRTIVAAMTELIPARRISHLLTEEDLEGLEEVGKRKRSGKPIKHLCSPSCRQAIPSCQIARGLSTDSLPVLKLTERLFQAQERGIQYSPYRQVGTTRNEGFRSLREDS